MREIRDARRLPREGHWSLNLAVFFESRIIGLQRLDGFDLWPRRRNVGTASWLAISAQGAGHGTRARVCVLDLAFDVLSAQAAMSWVLPQNLRSRRISDRLGYELVEEGTTVLQESKYMLSAERWRRLRPASLPPTDIEGAAALKAWLLP